MWAGIWTLIWLFLSRIVAPLLSLIFRALGIGGVTFIGFSSLLDTVKSQILSLVSGMPAAAIEIISMLGFFEVISLMFSALAVRLILFGVQGNKLTTWKRGTGTGTIFHN